MTQSHNIFDLFEAEAKKTPDAVAIIDDDGITTTYNELREHACQVSAYLLQYGISPEQPVGVLMSKTAGMIGVLLGILRSGAAYVPINGDDPPERQRRYLLQAETSLLFVDRLHILRADQLRNLVRDSLPVFTIVESESLVKKNWPVQNAPNVSISGLAYIMFTSGSTGDPKGVEVEHRNMHAVLQATADALRIISNDCFLAASSMSFDLSVADIFLPLMCGGRLVLRDNTCWTNASKLATDIQRYGVTVVATPPSLWSLVLGQDASFPHIRIAITCGEAAQISLARQLVDICDQAWNFYGPTECTVWCSAYHITEQGLNQDKHSAASISIGYPISGAVVRVADPQGKELPYGQEGELWVSGIGLSRGYKNDPMLTAAKFVCPPGEQVRYYRTGDLVSHDADGNLRYFGRVDDQMQIHGRRIEPGDVESAMRANPDVLDSAVTWYQNNAGSRSIVAAVVRQNKIITPYDLHKWLSGRLPKGMLPSHYVFTDSIPLLSSGKVNRNAIRNAVMSKIRASQTENRKLTTTEEFIIEAWKHVLKLESISPVDHFFTIGGDSLSAVILTTRIEAAVQIHLPDEFVYQNYTPEKMAIKLDHMRVNPVKTIQLSPRKSLTEKLYGRIKRLLRRYVLKNAKRRTRTLAEILDLQRLYVSVWQGYRTAPESLLVTLNPKGEKRPLFWCMQAYWELAEIARSMPDHPVHGMRSGPGVVRMHNEQEIKSLASHYAQEIQSVQPDGPLILGGNCFGARIMHYVAEQLRDLGRAVEMLILLEQQITRPYYSRIHLIYGRESSSNPYAQNASDVECLYSKLFPAGYSVDIVPGKYAELFRPENIQGVTDILHGILSEHEVHGEKSVR